MVNREITEIGKAVCFKIEVIISALSFGAVEVDICIPHEWKQGKEHYEPS